MQVRLVDDTGNNRNYALFAAVIFQGDKSQKIKNIEAE